MPPCPRPSRRQSGAHSAKGVDSPLGFPMLALRGKLLMPPYESAMGSMADSPVATVLQGERITGRAGVSPAQMEDAKSSFVAGGTPALPVGGLSRKTGDTPHRQQPVHKPCRGTTIEFPVFGKPKTTKLSAECLFYLTNWAPPRGTLGEYTVSPRSDLRSPASLPPQHAPSLNNHSSTTRP